MLTAEKVCEVLNEAHRADPAAIESLFHCRRSCGQALADHPHIQVSATQSDPPRFTVSFIGILTGLLTASGSARVVAAEYDDSGQILRGFVVRTLDPTTGALT